MRNRLRQVEAVNEMLSPVQLDLSMTGAVALRNNLWRFERLEYDSFDRPRLVKQIVRLDRMTGRRVFTNKPRFHGRFYCPAQNIPGSARLIMTMSGEQVVELDFQSMHVALAYHLCGARLVGDPYEGIPGFTRKQAKLGLLTASMRQASQRRRHPSQMLGSASRCWPTRRTLCALSKSSSFATPGLLQCFAPMPA